MSKAKDFRKVNKGEKGNCNICNKYDVLTDDHVPPKGCLSKGNYVSYSIYPRDDSNPEQFKEHQNGIKYRSLCKRCNNELLGRKYDPVMAKLTNDLKEKINSRFNYSRYISVTIKPNMIVRCLTGHILAASISTHRNKIHENLSEFFLDERRVFPKEYKVYTSLYFKDSIIIAKDILGNKYYNDFSSFVFFSILKFFPVAFVITGNQYYPNLKELTEFRNLGLDFETNINYDSEIIIPYDWPEKVSDGNIVLGGDEGKRAVKARQKSKG